MGVGRARGVFPRMSSIRNEEEEEDDVVVEVDDACSDDGDDVEEAALDAPLWLPCRLWCG